MDTSECHVEDKNHKKAVSYEKLRKITQVLGESEQFYGFATVSNLLSS